FLLGNLRHVTDSTPKEKVQIAQEKPVVTKGQPEPSAPAPARRDDGPATKQGATANRIPPEAAKTVIASADAKEGKPNEKEKIRSADWKEGKPNEKEKSLPPTTPPASQPAGKTDDLTKTPDHKAAKTNEVVAETGNKKELTSPGANQPDNSLIFYGLEEPTTE